MGGGGGRSVNIVGRRPQETTYRVGVIFRECADVGKIQSCNSQISGLYLSVEDESCVEDGAPYPLQNVGAGRLRGFRKCPVFVEDGPDDFP